MTTSERGSTGRGGGEGGAAASHQYGKASTIAPPPVVRCRGDSMVDRRRARAPQNLGGLQQRRRAVVLRPFEQQFGSCLADAHREGIVQRPRQGTHVAQGI